MLSSEPKVKRSYHGAADCAEGFAGFPALVWAQIGVATAIAAALPNNTKAPNRVITINDAPNRLQTTLQSLLFRLRWHRIQPGIQGTLGLVDRLTVNQTKPLRERHGVRCPFRMLLSNAVKSGVGASTALEVGRASL